MTETALRDAGNHSNRMAEDAVRLSVALPVKCSIVRYRALSCVIVHDLKNRVKIMSDFFAEVK